MATKRFAEATQSRTMPMPSMSMPVQSWQRPDALPDQPRLCTPHCRPQRALNPDQKPTPGAQLTATTPDFLIPDLQYSIARLDAKIEYLRQQIRVFIDIDEQFQTTFELLTSATGIADACAIQLFSELLLVPEKTPLAVFRPWSFPPWSAVILCWM